MPYSVLFLKNHPLVIYQTGAPGSQSNPIQSIKLSLTYPCQAQVCPSILWVPWHQVRGSFTSLWQPDRDETEEILDSILPPREWEEDGKLWRQSVSSTPATRSANILILTFIFLYRLDVMNLQEQLDLKLQQRQARETGICQVSRHCTGAVTFAQPLTQTTIWYPVFQTRRELYAQCFDELIRQSTINCTERGLLLLRVRDELRMTLHAYQVSQRFFLL